MKLLIASKNRGKYKEIKHMLEELDVDFCSLEDLGIFDDFEENGETFEENALGKARFYAEISGLPTVADDSGIFVEALADELGLKTRRWGAGEGASDEEWLDFFMKRMEQESNRNARFVCGAAFVNSDKEFTEVGETAGQIMEKLEVPIQHGIPLSSVFLPKGYDRVYAALTPAEKNSLSHRGKAFAKLLDHLKNE